MKKIKFAEEQRKSSQMEMLKDNLGYKQ